MSVLFTRHPMAFQTAFAELKRRTFEQPFLLVGTPGSIVVRAAEGRRFLYRDYYGPDGKKAGDYIGPATDAPAEARAAELRDQIALARALAGEGALLSQNGYVRVEPRTNAILTALANNGLFRAGALLVGAHSYGVLLNDLGARASATATEDIGVARAKKLGLDDDAKSLEDMLRDSRILLHPIPQLDRKKPSTSFKPPGPDRLRVDFLMPTEGREVKVLAAPELRAHATALPWLRYLVEASMPAIVIGRSTMVPVNVPLPERLAFHKMLVSQLRRETSEKATKDLEQAATLFAILAETAPESLETAFAKVPAKARDKTKRGARRVLDRLKKTRHQQAVELLTELLR
jgi:hypothetical protein